MDIQKKFINKYNGKKIANQLKKANLSAKEHDDLLTELEKIGAGYEGVLHHSDIEFDTQRNEKYEDCDEDISNFDNSLNFSISKDDILPTGAIIVGVQKVAIDDGTEKTPQKKTLKLDAPYKPRVDALIAYTYKKGAPFSECLSTSVNYYTQNKCTLTQCLGAKVVRHSEVNAENFNLVVGDDYELAYTRFANSYYRAMRLLDIVNLHKNEKLSEKERNQLKLIYSSARIIYNRALFNLISADDGFDQRQAYKMRREIVEDSKKLNLKSHIQKWKSNMITISSPTMIKYLDKESLAQAIKEEL